MGPPFRVAELDHVVVRCRDAQRTLAFYTEVLGLTEERRIDAIGLVQLRAGSSIVDLIADRTDEPRAAPNVDHFALGVAAADMGAVVGWLDAHAVERLGDPMELYGARGVGPAVYLRDPEGNVVELKLMPPEVGQRARPQVAQPKVAQPKVAQPKVAQPKV
jgi:glyoxylase I family protein